MLSGQGWIRAQSHNDIPMSNPHIIFSWTQPTPDHVRTQLCRLNRHQHRQPVFLVKFNSTPAPNTQLLSPSGIVVLGIESWVKKLADVA